MLSTDRKRFVSAVSATAAAFGKETTEELFAVFWGGLEDLPVEAVVGALVRAVQVCQFFPTVRDLREMSGGPSATSRIEMAWESLLRAIRSVGGYRSPLFEDAAITATIRSMGGWERICSMESEELHKWGRKEFDRIYPSWTTKHLPSKRMAGLHEVSNVHRPGRPVDAVEIPAPYLSIADKALMMPEEDLVDLLESPVQELIDGIGGDE